MSERALSSRSDGYRMWNLAPLLPTGPNGEPLSTRVNRGRGELIDHIFARHRPVTPDNTPKAAHPLTVDALPSMDGRPIGPAQ